MFGVWFGGMVLGLIVGGVALVEVPLWVKLAASVGVVFVGVLGRIGVIVLGGLLFSAGLLTFTVILLTSTPAAVSASMGVALLLAAAGAALSIRALFRHGRKDRPVAPPAPQPPDQGA